MLLTVTRPVPAEGLDQSPHPDRQRRGNHSARSGWLEASGLCQQLTRKTRDTGATLNLKLNSDLGKSPPLPKQRAQMKKFTHRRQFPCVPCVYLSSVALCLCDVFSLLRVDSLPFLPPLYLYSFIRFSSIPSCKFTISTTLGLLH